MNVRGAEWTTTLELSLVVEFDVQRETFTVSTIGHEVIGGH